ncbi:MAG TPA: DinB family protein [Puia sp.]|nr:DinB family protein [Puia sp.]
MQLITEKSDKKEILAAINEPISGMLELMSGLDPKEVNIVPYKDSWTAGMLFRHVSKSLKAMSKAMSSDARPAERDPGEKIPELKKTFLDFSTKLKSPDFIVPEEGPYEKQAIFAELNDAYIQLRGSSVHANLSDLVKGLPLGDITKLEILHFVLYHVQRHKHQMEKICDALKNKK